MESDELTLWQNFSHSRYTRVYFLTLQHLYLATKERRQLWLILESNQIYQIVQDQRPPTLPNPPHPFDLNREMLASLVGSAGKESSCNAGDLVWFLGWEDPLEKGKTTHSSILVRRIPWTVQSRKLQTAGHDWVILIFISHKGYESSSKFCQVLKATIYSVAFTLHSMLT